MNRGWLACSVAGLIVGCGPSDQRPDKTSESIPAKAAELPAQVRGEPPRFELRAGERYFCVDGRPAFVLGRNPVGMSPAAYDDHFRHAHAAGERFMRIHFTFSPPGEKAGQIDAGALKAWDEILDAAEVQGLGVLPTLGVWADWNDGSNREAWHTWDKNAFNVERGGPARRPSELFDDGACRKLWFERLRTLVAHWANRRAIVGWEIFSEVDLVTGATEERAVKFVESAAEVIRAADPWKRPITVSQAGVNEWPSLLRSKSIDFIQVHPYAEGFGGRLDELIISTVRARLGAYGKPVLLGECGLDSHAPRGTLDTVPRAESGIRHAIWASVVSGAMNGRMLWWQDGYDQFEQADLARHYHDAARAAAAFVNEVDYACFQPIACDLSNGLFGGLIGNDDARLGWFRDKRCQPPDWPVSPLAGQSVTMHASNDFWQVEFVDPVSGDVASRTEMTARDESLRIELPDISGSVALRLKRRAP